MNKFLKFVAASVLAATTLASYAASFVGERSDYRDETIYFAITTRFYDGDPSNNVCGWDRQSVQIAILRKTFFCKILSHYCEKWFHLLNFAIRG